MVRYSTAAQLRERRSAALPEHTRDSACLQKMSSDAKQEEQINLGQKVKCVRAEEAGCAANRVANVCVAPGSRSSAKNSGVPVVPPGGVAPVLAQAGCASARSSVLFHAR